MAMKLPTKNAPPTDSNVRELNDGLTSVMAGHPGAVYPWTFYEVLDEYLGPWGAAGYPIGYGKKYCVLFNSNEKLQANPITKRWVWKTTILLQEPLRDYVVAQFRQGTLAALREAQLRQYAFDSHPFAYTRGGLTLVVMVAPNLIGEIASIPGAEFDPRSPDFSATVLQVFATFGMVAPRVVGVSIATLAGPAHTGIFSLATRRDSEDFSSELSLGRSLTQLKRLIAQGSFDDLLVLEEITKRLNRTEYPDSGFGRLAQEIVTSANGRKCVIVSRYKSQSIDPAMSGMVTRVSQMCQQGL